MEICSEHGEDIAYMGRDCPACEEVQDLNREHEKELAYQHDEMQEEINELSDKIDELENQ